MRQPSWYRDSERWLIDHGGREGVTVALLLIVIVCLYFMVAMWSDKKMVLPAAAFAVYMWMP